MRKKVDFLFEYEVKNRELESLCLIAAYLRKKGYSAGFVNSWQSLYEEPEKYKAKVMILSACYNDGTYNYFTALADSYDKVVNMQWEQVLQNHHYVSTERPNASYAGVGLHTRHVCWGEKERRWLIERFGVDADCLKVVGYVPLDFYRPELRPAMMQKERLFARYGLDPHTRTVLFISSFAGIGLPDTEGHGDDGRFAKLLKTETDTQKELLCWFSRLADQHPEWQIVYRGHPAEKDNPAVQKLTQEHKNIFAISEMPINSWLCACDKICSWASTSLIEMLEAKKDLYILRPYPVPQEVDMPVYQSAKCITTYEAFARAIAEPMPGPPVDIAAVRQWYDVQEKPAYERIGDWLIETLHDRGYHSRPIRCRPVRTRAREFVKGMPGFLPAAGWLCRHAGENRITEKISKMKKEVEYQRYYKEQMEDKNGYIYEKYMRNRATQEEIEQRLALWESLI